MTLKHGSHKSAVPRRIDDARQALDLFARLERKNCLAYEFVALKLGCSREQAAKLVAEIHRVADKQ
jgi:hypothetical protein